MSDRGWKLTGWVLAPCLLWGGTGYVAYQPTTAVVQEARMVAQEAKADLRSAAWQLKWHIKAVHDAARIMRQEAQQRLES